MGSNVSKPIAPVVSIDEKAAVMADLVRARRDRTTNDHEDAPDFGEELACSHLEEWSKDFEEVHTALLFSRRLDVIHQIVF